MSFLKGRFLKRFYTGLLFSIVGFLLITFQSSNASFLSYGILTILLGHIFYIRSFYLDFRSAPELDKKGARVAILVAFIWSVSFYFYVRPSLGKAQLPVLICTLIVSFMLMMAAFRNQRVNQKSFNLILIGTVLLALADALFVYFSFVNSSFSFTNYILIATFIIAHMLLILGAGSRRLIHTHAE